MHGWSLDPTNGSPSAYRVSPECAERQCTITRQYEPLRMQFFYQHGDNPEAVLIVDRISCALDPSAEARRRFREWAERIHRYEDGTYEPA